VIYRSTTALVAAFLIAFAASAFANTVTTWGGFSCRNFLLEISKGEAGEIGVVDDVRWMEGYLSAMAIHLPTKSDPLKYADAETMRDWTNKYCQSNPTKDGAAAADTLFERLNK
jgi:hypothetical protein